MTTRILTGDARDILKTLPDNSIDCVVTARRILAFVIMAMTARSGWRPRRKPMSPRW